MKNQTTTKSLNEGPNTKQQALVVNALFHKTNVTELSEFTSRPYCWRSDRFARAADIDSALASTLPHVSTASTRLSLED